MKYAYLGGDNLLLSYNIHAVNFNNDSYVTPLVCPPRYCCNEFSGCSYSTEIIECTEGECIEDKQKLCSNNRDPTYQMCGRCLSGYSETLSPDGKCNKCDESNIWILFTFLWFIGCFITLYGLYFIISKERAVAHPFITYISRTLLFFYQIIGFMLYRAIILRLQTVSEFANFNFDFRENGTC